MDSKHHGTSVRLMTSLVQVTTWLEKRHIKPSFSVVSGASKWNIENKWVTYGISCVQTSGIFICIDFFQFWETESSSSVGYIITFTLIKTSCFLNWRRGYPSISSYLLHMMILKMSAARPILLLAILGTLFYFFKLQQFSILLQKKLHWNITQAQKFRVRTKWMNSIQTINRFMYLKQFCASWYIYFSWTEICSSLRKLKPFVLNVLSNHIV